ncbi:MULTISPECIES: D-aminoacyl-tRNA deacylase [unclassified Marinobacter]|uniref:D-aminoacyl-tRNA deacylase n=1 Tax=unclassified Marinobacter TaxID=83889 RepID=UPI0026E1A380|nr:MULTISPECIES: D-aminoacyl-tRNA deacylase [unclassified Marinobacter]MDO6443865.1 D-aminoacyl-tRNA deacylase [Marinobacter sp. 2_MG-2023]MDO6825246.1 D-aminoacyl-tRNA deacylase [Marinobacter sp. 1_MG-2023]
MKGLVQRVSEASVEVDDREVSRIGAGILLLLGVENGDGLDEAKELCRRVLTYRIFPDEAGRMNRSVLDTGGALLVVPQFTLAADTSSGTRPGFSLAAGPDIASEMCAGFIAFSRAEMGAERVKAGLFGADMKVSLINDGPATFLLSTRKR